MTFNDRINSRIENYKIKTVDIMILFDSLLPDFSIEDYFKHS